VLTDVLMKPAHDRFASNMGSSDFRIEVLGSLSVAGLESFQQAGV
jgi:hypothetical protein